MFQNSYQNGGYFDFFDPKVNPDKLKPLMKPVNLPVTCKVFDKDLKTYVIEALTSNAKLQFPRQDKKDLYLIQQFLIFQIYFFQGMPWNIELTVSDLTKTKRRIILSPATTKLEIKPFFVKEPCKGWREGIWNNFVVDLYSFMEAFKGQTYRSLDSIHISGHFKLRRIYTTASEPFEVEGEEIKPLNFLPKQFNFPMGLPYVSFTNKYEADAYSHAPSDITEHSTKNSSFLKSSKTKSIVPPSSHQKKERMSRQRPKQIPRVEEVKTEEGMRGEKRQKKKEVSHHQVKVESQHLIKRESSSGKGESVGRKGQIKKKKDFLSNTNGELIGRKKQKLILDSNAESQKLILSSKPLHKPGKQPKEISNPWRNNEFTGSNLAISKHEDNSRKAVTPQQNGSGFKKAKEGVFAQTKNKFDSDSDYVQLSQKFSTLTDGKFFKHQFSENLGNRVEEPEEEDEIEENIEMEENSISSSRIKKEENHRSKLKGEVKEQLKEELIKESIGDSLDELGGPQKAGAEMGRSSLYGFGENLMRNFMHDIERPYSPPIGEKQSMQQQSPIFKGEKDEVQLIFDPVLNCYYDYKTHTYYQLKN